MNIFTRFKSENDLSATEIPIWKSRSCLTRHNPQHLHALVVDCASALHRPQPARSSPAPPIPAIRDIPRSGTGNRLGHPRGGPGPRAGSRSGDAAVEIGRKVSGLAASRVPPLLDPWLHEDRLSDRGPACHAGRECAQHRDARSRNGPGIAPHLPSHEQGCIFYTILPLRRGYEATWLMRFSYASPFLAASRASMSRTMAAGA